MKSVTLMYWKKVRLVGGHSKLTASKKSLTKNFNVMQSNEILDKIYHLVKEVVGDMDFEEAIQLHHDYQNDSTTTICPCCESSVSEDELVYVEDYSSSYEDPSESHNECPHCNMEISAGSLEKPEFETWLSITS